MVEKIASRSESICLYFFVLELVPLQIILSSQSSLESATRLRKSQKVRYILLCTGILLSICMLFISLVIYIIRIITNSDDNNYDTKDPEWSEIIDLVLTTCKLVPDLIVSYMFALLAIFFIHLKSEKLKS